MPRYLCKRKCFFLDRSIRPGEIVDIPAKVAEAKADILGSSFSPFDADKAKPAAPEQNPLADPAALTDDEKKRRLVEWGVTFNSRIKKADLEKLYTEQVATHLPKQPGA